MFISSSIFSDATQVFFHLSTAFGSAQNEQHCIEMILAEIHSFTLSSKQM